MPEVRVGELLTMGPRTVPDASLRRPDGYAGGFRDTELGVDPQGALPVPVCVAGLAGGMPGSGQAMMGACLLVAVTSPAGEGKRGGMVLAGLAGLADGQQSFSSAVERRGFPIWIADLAVQGQRL